MIEKIFKPPIFENEKDTHQAYLLNVILWGLILMPIPYVLFVQINLPEEAWRAWLQAGIGEAVNFFLLILLKRGYVRVASIIQVISFWLFFTLIAFNGNGVQDEAYIFGYPLVILIAGLLLGAKSAIWITIISLLVGLGMVVEIQSDRSLDSNHSALFTWVISFVIFPVIAILQYLSSRAINQALERVRVSEQKQKLISKVSTDYTFESVVNEKGEADTVWISGALEKMTGYTAEEYLAAGGWYAFIHPDDREKDAKDMEKLLRNEDIISSEIRTIAKNGEIRWERVFAHPIWSKEENRLVGIVGAVQDITQQKYAEESLKDTLLQQAAILNNIPDMAWLKDKDGKYIAVNEQFYKFSKLEKKDVIGKTDYDLWDHKFAALYTYEDQEVMKTKEQFHAEEQSIDTDGNLYWSEITKMPIFNLAGEVVGTTGMAREINERKTAEIEREILIQELESKNAELERFTYTVSHDLKSPLVTITGFLNYLEKHARKGDFENFKKDLLRINQAVEKMQILLRDLLELSRIGRMMNEPVKVFFGEIVREALKLVEGNIVARKVSIDFIDEGHIIFGDKIRLIEVLQNLIENAIKFMGAQPQPIIKIGSMINSENHLIFFVKDNGIGIDAQFTERIFGLFNKLDANAQGSGIGLTIVKRIVEVHNGKVWVESQLGQGSTFYFTLSKK